MDRKDDIKMLINIAGVRISRNVPFDQQDLVREIEKEVGKLSDEWRAQFPSRPAEYILAMIAFQYAYYFRALGRNYEDGMAALESLDSRIASTLAHSAD